MDEARKQKLLRILEARTSINSETGCWEYEGVNGAGYGQVTIDGKFYYTHQLSAEIFLGYNPLYSQILHVLHTRECSSKACWNFHHLYIGTNEENIRDREEFGNSRRGRYDKTHCDNGHEYTEANTYWSERTPGQKRRQCRECRAIRDREAKARKKLIKLA